MTTATPRFPLGTYVYNPSSTDPSAEAEFETQFGSFTQAMGAKPQFMDAFTDYNAAWSQWVPNENAMALSWAASPVLSGVTPVMTIPMASSADWDHADQTFKDIIAGKHDDVFTGLVNSWKAAGYTTIDARIGDEMNGGFVPWYMGNDPATVADWVAAFQHIADLVHAVPGIKVNTVWNPVTINWTAQPTASAYPGDRYVDIIGADIYSTVYPVELYDWGKNDGTVDSTLQQWFSDPVNREHYWMNPNATQWATSGNDGSQWGFKQVLAFAEAHNKPLGLAETGAGGNGTSLGPIDDPDFPKWLAGQLSQPGAPQVAFVNIWDINPADGGWKFTDGSKPQELAAWQQYFGVPEQAGKVSLPAVPVVSTGSTASTDSTASTGAAAPALMIYNATTRSAVANTLSQSYTGPVAGLQMQFIDITTDSLNITANAPNYFIHTGSGNDAIALKSGVNVVDSGTGSNFLTSGSGTDTFFIDGRNTSSDTWNTVANFHSGDAVTFWGISPSAAALTWVNSAGAAGYTGLTLHARTPGGQTASLTLAGLSQADMSSGKIVTQFGHDAASGSDYLYVRGA